MSSVFNSRVLGGGLCSSWRPLQLLAPLRHTVALPESACSEALLVLHVLSPLAPQDKLGCSDCAGAAGGAAHSRGMAGDGLLGYQYIETFTQVIPNLSSTLGFVFMLQNLEVTEIVKCLNFLFNYLDS